MTDTTVRDVVKSYLQALQERGELRLPVDESARSILTNWFKAAKLGRVYPQTYNKSGDDIAAELPDPSNKEASAGAKKPSNLPSGLPYLSEQIMQAEKEEKKNTPPPAPIPVTLEVPNGTVEEKLRFLYKQAANWAPVKELGSLRETMVFATGNPHTRIMLIGEAPGFQEEQQKEPFVGPAGEKLNQILKAMGFERKDLYISNIVKFRPGMPRQTTNNRPPTDAEIASCLPIITEEIKAIQPEVIIALGGSAAQGLLGSKASVSSLRGKFHDLMGIPLRVTYHPSYLLRSESPRDKRLVWEDMLSVMEKLGMPISEKQRNYFLPKR